MTSANCATGAQSNLNADCVFGSSTFNALVAGGMVAILIGSSADRTEPSL
jgi:hypothetical protein